MTDTFTVSDDYASALTGVIGQSSALLSTSEVLAQGEAFIGQLQAYLDASTQTDRQLPPPQSEEVPFELGEDRETLFWTAVGDLVVFRCAGLVEFWSAVQQADITNDRDLQVRSLQGYLLYEFGETELSFNAHVMPRLRGGQGSLPDLQESARGKARKIANESTSNVVEAFVGTLGGLVPGKTPGVVVRALTRVGRIMHLDRLYEIAKDLLQLALDKLHHIFGPNLDAITDEVKKLLDKFLKIEERIADFIYEVPDLLDRIDVRIDEIDAYDEILVNSKRERLEHVYARFEQWSFGFEIADQGFKWGRRLSTIAPPVRAVLEVLRAVSGAGAYLIGQYNLDSPTWGWIPWNSQGVVWAL